MRAVALALLGFSCTAFAYDWLQFGGDAQHSSVNALEQTITKLSVGQLAVKYSVTLPASADGAPVVSNGVLFVGTSDAQLVALDAVSGAILWTQAHRNTGCAIPNGIVCTTNSSPAIDPNRQYVYLYGLDGFVHKHQVGNGTEVTGGGWPELVTAKATEEKVSSPLSVATVGTTSYLYATVATAFDDQFDYQGHLVAINLATGSQRVFNFACSNLSTHLTSECAVKQNGTWSRTGPVYDALTNRLFVSIGNGVNNQSTMWSESVLALKPDGSGLVDSFTPSDFQSMDDGDADLGCTSLVLLPNGLGLQAGKDAKFRIINRSNLSGQGGSGHLGGDLNRPSIGFDQGICSAQPLAWTDSHGTWAYGVGENLNAFTLDASGNATDKWNWTNFATPMGVTSPLLVNGMLIFQHALGTIALDAQTGAKLWSTTQTPATHWSSPIVANGTLYALQQSTLTAYTTGAVTPPPPPPPQTTLLNGSFESPPTSSYGYSPAGANWTFGIGTGVQHNGSDWGAPTATAGVQTAFVQGNWGTLSQTVTLAAGCYAVTFQAAQRQCCDLPYGNPVAFAVDGKTLGTVSPGAAWQTFSFPIAIGVAGPHTFSFTGSQARDVSSFIDGVTLQ